MKKRKILSEVFEITVTNFDDYACPNVQNLILKDKECVRRVATIHIVMQKIFTVQKEKHLHTEHGHVFSINCNFLNYFFILFFFEI